MTESSVLKPEEMISQSEAAITALQADNDSFINAKKA